MDKRWFTLVECLEEVTDFWNYGHDFTTVPSYNVYMPTKNHVVNKPNMLDDRGDDTSYRYNEHRVSPYFFLNTLKGYKMGTNVPLKKRPFEREHKRSIKWKRLS